MPTYHFLFACLDWSHYLGPGITIATHNEWSLFKFTKSRQHSLKVTFLIQSLWPVQGKCKIKSIQSWTSSDTSCIPTASQLHYTYIIFRYTRHCIPTAHRPYKQLAVATGDLFQLHHNQFRLKAVMRKSQKSKFYGLAFLTLLGCLLSSLEQAYSSGTIVQAKNHNN